MINLVARTLGGSEYNVQIDEDDTIFDLKQVIATQAEDFQPSEMRLLKGTQTLTDDKKISDCGLKDGGTVHMVKALKGASPPSQNDEGSSGVEVKDADPNIFTVTLPPGKKAGDMLNIMPPGRQQMKVIVPRGVTPGGNFRVRLPPLPNQQAAPRRAPQQQMQQQQQLKIMQVKCPAGAHGGDAILIMVPGRGKMRVVVPSNVSPGQMFKFQVPV